MSDLILESNRSSVILSSLAKAEVKDLTYEIAPSYPILTKRHQVISANVPSTATGTLAGQEVTFNINKSMLWRDCALQTVYSTATATPLTAFPGIQLIDYIQIKSNNKVFFNITGYAYRSWLENQPESIKVAAYRMAMALEPTTEIPTVATSSVSYTLIPCSFFDAVMSNFDLNFYEQISVTVKYQASSALACMYTVTLASASLWVFLWRPDDKYYDFMRSKNQNPSKPLNMLTWNSYTEPFVPTSATSNTVRLNCNYPVFKTVVRVVPVIRDTTGYDDGLNVPITSLSFSVGGNEVLTTVPRSVGMLEKSRHGASFLVPTSATAVTMDQVQGYTLDFGMEPQNWVSNSGAVSFSQLNYPTITVVTPSMTNFATEFLIQVTHFYWNILTLQSTNGSLGITVSN